jgi:iron-sulfur cluster assembly protein
MAITITENAKEKLLHLLSKRQTPNHYFKVGLRGGGCSGYMYDYSFVSEPTEKDKTFQFDNLKICIDIKSYLFLNGMEIDYQEDLFKSGIVFNNPNQANSCGCGESITF